MKYMSLILALAIILLDALSKNIIINLLTPLGGVWELNPYFNLVLTHNYGVSFGMFNTSQTLPLIMICITLIIITFVVYLWWRTAKNWEIWGYAAVMGGGLGNVLDRVRFGYVVDFLDFHYKNWHYPAFNIADSAIVLGVIALIFTQMILAKGEKQ